MVGSNFGQQATGSERGFIGLQVGEYIRAMGFCFDLTVYPLYIAIFVDEKRGAENAIVFFAHEFFPAPSAVGFNCFTRLVGQ